MSPATVAENASYEFISKMSLCRKRIKLTSPMRRHKETKSVTIILAVF